VPLPMDNPALYGVGGCGGHQQAFGHRLGGGGGAPAWLPEGAVAGVDYTEGEAWLFDTLITDLSTIHGNHASGNFDPAAITAAGMAVTIANANRPAATNELADVFLACDFCILMDFDLLADSNDPGYLIYAAELGGAFNFLYTNYDSPTGEVTWTDGGNGEFIAGSPVTFSARNKVASSANAAGWLTSVNGATATLDTPVTPALVGLPVFASIGANNGGIGPLNGTIRRIIFYPNEQNAAFIEALSSL
jgi:hypothetical protein